MNKITTSLLVAAACVGIPAGAVEIADLTPGSLAGHLESSMTGDLKELRLSGTIDVRDLIVVADLPALVSLDLSDASIAAYTPDRPLALAEGDFPADYLPAGLFFGKHLGSVSLPASLTAIGSHALAGNDFAAIVLPDKLNSIGDYAFYDCDRLTSVALPSSVSEVGSYAFAGCDLLASVDMSGSRIEFLPDYLFRNSVALAQVKFPASLKGIGTGVYAGCSALTSVALPSSLEEIGELSFSHSALQSIEIPSSVNSVGDFAYSRCDAMTTASVASSDVELGDGVFFYSKALKEVKMDGLESIPDYTFAGNSALPFASSAGIDDVKTIGAYALLDTQAETITLPATLLYLSDGALEGVTGLKKIDASALGDRVPELGENVFAGINQSEVELLVAEDTGSVWENAPQWKEFKVNAPVGVDGVRSDVTAVKAWFEGRVLQIEAPCEIETVAIFLSNGAKAFHVEPYSSLTSVDTSDFADRVYIVEVITSEGRRVFKLLR